MNINKFQVTVLALFAIGIVGGLLALALVKSDNVDTSLPALTIWGTVRDDIIESHIERINRTRDEQLSIRYEEYSEQTFANTLTEALAQGTGPDAILVAQDSLLAIENKLLTIPYTSLDARTYKNTFIEQAELYLRAEGFIGIPYIIDPLVMYWNRDLFTNAGFATYPTVWDDFLTIIPKITQKDTNSNIRKSAISLGEFANIEHARDLFGLMLLQAGNPIVSQMQSTLSDKSTERALNFYIGFSNPASPAYSWNRSLPSSKNYFLAGNLATYFGFASELDDIRAKNPNLNFDIAPLPQPKNIPKRVAYSQLYGFSIAKSAKSPVGTLAVLTELVTAPAIADLVSATYLPPVRRDTISQGTADPYLKIFYDAALISKGWLDPNKAQTSRIFQTMIESVVSGRDELRQAIEQANNELNILLQR